MIDDTSKEIREKMDDLYRKMTPAEKIRRMCDLIETTEMLAISDILKQRPQSTPHEIRILLAVRKYGKELVSRAYGPHPCLSDVD
jgi:hypothetical protein